MLCRVVREVDVNGTVAGNTHFFPGRFDTLERPDDVPSQLFVGADELHPESLQRFLELTGLSVIAVAFVTPSAKVMPDLGGANLFLRLGGHQHQVLRPRGSLLMRLGRDGETHGRRDRMTVTGVNLDGEGVDAR